ncbi:MAG: dihydroorotase, partial [bacterium]|nr:dihydroorotase [bacterium]
MSILIQGVRAIDPSCGINTITDVYIEGTNVTIVAPNIKVSASVVIDGTGKLLIPGLIDIHAHLREPGREHKETIQTGGRAAAVGGFTSVCCMPNTLPALDSLETMAYVQHKALRSPVRIFPIAAITKGLKGQELTNAFALRTGGAVAFSDDGEPVMNTRLLYEALIQSKVHGAPIIVHCEDKFLSENGVMHEGEVSCSLGLPGIPAIAEESMIARDIALAQASKGHLHIAHVSTALGVSLIRQAKLAGIKLTAEVTPHHLTMTVDMVSSHSSLTKVNPPLRTKHDVQALREAIITGTIDCIATDHAPHSQEEKSMSYLQAPFGISGLETAFPMLMTELVLRGILSLEKL